MNAITYNKFPKTFDEIKERLSQSIDSCENSSQLVSVLKFNAGYIEAVDYFDNIQYKEVTDEMIKEYFEKPAQSLKGEGEKKLLNDFVIYTDKKFIEEDTRDGLLYIDRFLIENQHPQTNNYVRPKKVRKEIRSGTC